jgi:phosphoribosylformylglycinamidine synthase PurS subunit
MKFKAEIDVMPLPEILDPQGKAVGQGLQNLGLVQVEGVRIGKHITLHMEANNANEAEVIVLKACQNLLSNMIMENFTFHISEQ